MSRIIDTEPLVIESTYREQDAYSLIDKIYRRTVLSCGKCDKGFLRENINPQTETDFLYFKNKKCKCYHAYETLRSYAVAGIPQEFWGMKDIDLQIDEKSKKNIGLYVQRLELASDKGIGILFLGSQQGINNPNSGAGKTSSAIHVLQHALAIGKPIYYTTMHSYFAKVYRTIEGDEDHYCHNLIDEIENVDFLCIDEVGKIKKTEYVYRRFEDMLRQRFSHLLVTLLITNMNEKELAEYVGPSLMDILRNNLLKISLIGDSYRAKRFQNLKQSIKMEV